MKSTNCRNSQDEELELTEIGDCEGFCENHDSTEIDAIPRLLKPQYYTFFENYLRTNKPCVVADAASGWECAARWTRDGSLQYDYLVENYGNMTVSISDCRNPDRPPVQRSVREYMEYLSGADGNRAVGHCWYLKDWHLRRERPSDRFYKVPSQFGSDWLNEYALENKLDDFMFVYIGPEGSWTPLHADVYSSYSWSVNVTGCKRWLFLPPGEERHLADSTGRLPREFCAEDHPQCLELIQGAGDAVFVPSGWHHIVYNVRDTISVNQNWMNGCNVLWVWRALDAALTRVEGELADLKDEDSFPDDCQRVLKCDFGMDYEDFVNLLEYIAGKRARQIRGDISVEVPSGYRLGPRHLAFDLRAALSAIEAVLHDTRANFVLSSSRLVQLKLVTTSAEGLVR